jgi:hypothetical protein
MSKIEGGCLCGRIRYESDSEIVRAYHCHCLDCQKLSGTSGLSLLAIPDSDFRISGELKFFEKTGDSGSKVSLGFCPDCGSNIVGKPQRLAGMIAIAAGTLDDSSLFKPTLSIFSASAPSWHVFGNEIHKFPGSPQ